ncbi:flagellin [Methanothermococcus sp.]|uniref:flagellin n=1 Tax=Methanothermococcus sp. TaxID=2614238 RepID=UPI0025F58986|nr:flagellin [Methanothermococcus sp.]
MLKFLKNKRGAIGIGTLIIFIALVLVAAVAAAVIINTAGKLQHKASTVGQESTEQVASGVQVLKVSGYADVNSTDSFIIINKTSNETIINNSKYRSILEYPQYNRIKGIAIFIGPNIGDDIDLSSTIITLSNEDKKVSLVYSGVIKYADTNGTENIFNGLVLNGANDSVNTTMINTSEGEHVNGSYVVIRNSDEVTVGKDGWVLNNVPKFGVIVLQDADKSTYGAHPTINYGDKVILTVNTGVIFEPGVATREKIFGEVIPEYGASGIIEFRTPSVFGSKIVALQ